jgi:hypothetical protein
MTQTVQQNGLTSSPQSSDYYEHSSPSRHDSTHPGSPESKITAFSPDDTHLSKTPKKAGTEIDQDAPPAFAFYFPPAKLQQLSTSDENPKLLSEEVTSPVSEVLNDPFITLRHGSDVKNGKLSPTASSFTPLAFKADLGVSEFGRLGIELSTNGARDAENRVRDKSVGRPESEFTTSILGSRFLPRHSEGGVFSTDTTTTRYLVVKNISRGATIHQVNNFFKASGITYTLTFIYLFSV